MISSGVFFCPQLRSFLIYILLIIGLCASATETENFGLQILPAPVNVNVDGASGEWDLSASVFACGDVENYRDKFGVWFSAMYDSQKLYLLARWNDDTPMNNSGSTAGNFGWDGDCIQIRVVADYDKPYEQRNVFNCWYGADGKDVVERDTPGKTKRSPKGDDIKADGALQAFKKNADGKGYVQEIAIPWALITGDGLPRKAGDSLVLTIEPNFTAGPTNGRMSIKDIFRPGITLDRVFTFQNKRIWGIATLETAGKVSPRPVRLSDSREFAVKLDNGISVVNWAGINGEAIQTGFKPIKFTLPVDGIVSLQILNDKGDVVRNLLTAEPLKKGAQEVLWDGLTMPMYRSPGQPVPSGVYSWRAIYHTGIGIVLRGWACSSGQTPWDGPNAGDNWGGDMGAPCAVTTDGKKIYLGWGGSEAGKALVVTDFAGIVQWRHKRGGFGGAQLIAVDVGTAYVLDGGDLFCLDTATGKYVPWAGGQTSDVAVASLWPADILKKPAGLSGLDARNGKLYMTGSSIDGGWILIIDAKTGKAVKTISVPVPGAIRVVTDDKLYVVSNGKTVLCLNTATGAQNIVVDKLSNIAGLAVDAAGNIYVAVNAPDYQVKVFRADGKALRVIGKKGGRPLEGPWQAQGMYNLAGITVDASGQLWVTENTLYPRRISVWNAKNGKLVKELFGPTHYGASGGAIHPKDPNVMVGEGCEWKLNAKTGKASCKGVFDTSGQGFLGGNGFARFCIGNKGRDYLAVMQGANMAIYERLSPGRYAKRSTISSDRKTNKTVIWSDINNDQQAQENENLILPQYQLLGGYYNWSMYINTDMTVYGGNGYLPVTGYTACGAPKYDPAAFKAIPGLPAGLPSLDNKLVLACGVEQTEYYQCNDTATGKQLWRYPNQFAGVHGSHVAPPPVPGMLRGAFGPVGSAKVPVAGDIWAINTNVGEWHILTRDGYYLTRLFEPDGLKVEFPDKVVPGVRIDRVPGGMGGEDFGGSLVQAVDGKVYLQAGKVALWNCQLTGLDGIKSLPGGSIDFTADDAKQAIRMREIALQQVVGIRRAAIRSITPTFTGSIGKDFTGAEIINYKKQDDAAVRTAMTWDTKNLYAGWEVTDKTPWVNGATDPVMLYLSGDTADLQIGTNPKADKNRGEAVAGDIRISIGNYQGKATAVLYRKISDIKKPRLFSSGIMKDYEMQYADVLTDAVINVAVNPGKGYTIEVALPLATLGLKPTGSIRGDIGVTHGDPAGQRTRLRTYWSNQQTGLVDDAVFELMMTPKNWGELECK